MPRDRVQTVPASLAEPGSPSIALPSADSGVTLELILAALARQRRTTQALYRLVRGMARSQGRSSRTGRARREVDSAALYPPAAPALPAPDSASRLVSAPSADGAGAPCRAPRLEVRCFGRFEVSREGVPVQRWRRGKAKTLLKYLVVRRQPVPRDVLLDLLWPETDPRSATNGLRVALHALRQDLGPCRGDDGEDLDYVIFDAGNYILNPAARPWVDADEFMAHVEAGRGLERQQQLADAARQYELAEAIYREDYLLEDLYEDWTLVRREELKDHYLMVVTKLADNCLRRGDAEGCIVRCHRILQKDPCREDAYQRLMRCYVHLGHRSQAVHWYDLCVRTLRQELDVAPAEQTRRLYLQITSGRGV